MYNTSRRMDWININFYSLSIIIKFLMLNIKSMREILVSVQDIMRCMEGHYLPIILPLKLEVLNNSYNF